MPVSSEVEVCNIALGAIGAKSLITDLDPTQGTEERHCALFFNATREMVLRDKDWPFARKTIALVQLTDDPIPGWDYRYQYPTDCLAARKVINSTDAITPQKFELGISDDLNDKNIFSNQESAYLQYTARVTITPMYDSNFIFALAYALAARLAMPLTKKPAMQSSMQQQYMSLLSMAATNAANEEHQGDIESKYVSEISTARGG